MAEDKNQMVIRSVYLPIAVDRRLRSISFTRGIPKGDLVRQFIQEGLDRFAASGERTLAERIEDRSTDRSDAGE